MAKFFVTVTLEFSDTVEAETKEEAESLIRNEDWDDFPKNVSIDVEPLEE